MEATTGAICLDKIIPARYLVPDAEAAPQPGQAQEQHSLKDLVTQFRIPATKPAPKKNDQHFPPVMCLADNQPALGYRPHLRVAPAPGPPPPAAEPAPAPAPQPTGGPKTTGEDEDMDSTQTPPLPAGNPLHAKLYDPTNPNFHDHFYCLYPLQTQTNISHFEDHRAYVIATQPVLYATFVDMLNQTILNGLGPDHLKAKWEEVHGFEPPQAGHPGPHDDEVGEPAHHP